MKSWISFGVSAINNNGVTVKFPALSGDIEAATVTVKDPAGNEVAVVAQNLSKGATSATFPFTAPQSSLAAGTWTVDGKEILVKSQDAGLQNLVTDLGEWSEDFAKDKLEGGSAVAPAYSVNVQNDVSSINLTPTAAEGATITATVSSTAPGFETKTQVLNNNTANKINLGSATTSSTQTSVVITVVAPDQQTSKTYSLGIDRAAANAANNAYATALTVDGNALQGYKQDSYSYSTNVAAAKDSVPVKVTPADTASTVYINGDVVKLATGVATKNVNLSYGKNTVEVKVVAPDNSTSKTYTVEVNRANPNGSTVNTLNNVTLSAGEVTGFTADATNATIATKVPHSVNELTITPVATNAKASVFVANEGTNTDLKVEKQGSSYVVKGLKDGNSNKVNIITTSETGVAATTVLAITRAADTASDVASLDNTFEVNGLFAATGTTFKPTVTDYNFNVANTTAALGTVTAAAEGSGTISYKLNGVTYKSADLATAPLKIGNNKLEVKVTSENTLNTRTYTVNINRADVNASTVNTLKSLALSNGTLTGFKADDSSATTLSTSVANNVEDLTITPTTTDSKAQVTVTATAPGSAKLDVEKSGTGYVIKGLKAGANIVTIKVTPESAGAATTYTLTVNKAGVAANDNANLTTAVIGGNTLNFGSSQTTASTNVTYATSSVALGTLTVSDTGNATAVWKKNGQVVTGNQSLAVGANTFEVEVTAANGTTKKTYTITVNRAAETASKQAGLSALTVDKGTYIPASEIKSNVTAAGNTADTGTLYVGSASEFNSVTFTATPADANATVEVLPVGTPNGITTSDITKNTNGTFTVASLDKGDTFEVKVTSPDTSATYTTTVTVDRAASGDSPFATLSNLTVAFKAAADNATATGTAADVKIKPDTKSYEYFVSNASNEVKLTKATPADDNKTVTFELNGKTYASGSDLPLAVGKNVVTVNTLAADNVTKDSYTLTINRASSSVAKDATATLKDNDGATISSPVSVVAGAAYTFTVNPTDADATVKVSAKASNGDAVQVAKVNGKYVVDGQPAGSTTTVTVETIAADKATKSTKTFDLTVAP